MQHEMIIIIIISVYRATHNYNVSHTENQQRDNEMNLHPFSNKSFTYTSFVKIQNVTIVLL